MLDAGAAISKKITLPFSFVTLIWCHIERKAKKTETEKKYNVNQSEKKK